DSPANGICLAHQASGEVVHIAPTAVVVNEPKRVTFVAPTPLHPGDYKLSLTTQYAGSSTLLKEPRTCLFDYVLAVQ
ncbi:MAG: DUF4469 domain-containing protein, partial [Prevotellaceae bacterium]|nr:DUF4469 domain-containing protein [Prevotellaceae bacterium]